MYLCMDPTTSHHLSDYAIDLGLLEIGLMRSIALLLHWQLSVRISKDKQIYTRDRCCFGVCSDSNLHCVNTANIVYTQAPIFEMCFYLQIQTESSQCDDSAVDYVPVDVMFRYVYELAHTHH